MINRHRASALSAFSFVSYTHNANLVGSLQSSSFGQAGVRSQIDLKCGNLVVQDHLLRFADIGEPVEFVFTYNHLAKERWQLQWGRRGVAGSLVRNQKLVIREADGREVTYHYDGKYYVAADNNCLQRVSVDEKTGEWTHYHPETEVTEILDADGYLKQRTDQYNHVTRFQHDKIVTASGVTYEIKQDYCDISIYRDGKLMHRYKTDSAGNLKNSIFDHQYETTYFTETDGALMGMTQSDKSACWFGFLQNKINSINVPNENNKYSFAYGDNKTVVTTETNESLEVIFDGDKLKKCVHGNVEFGYRLTPLGLIEGIIYPDKTEDSLLWGENGKLKKHTLRNSTFVKYEYSEGDNSVLTVKYLFDVKKLEMHATHFIYEEDAAGVKRLRFIISPGGCVEELVVDKDGLTIGKRSYAERLNAASRDKGIDLNSILDWKEKNVDMCQSSYSIMQYDGLGQLKSIVIAEKVLKNGEMDPAGVNQEHSFVSDERGNLLESAVRVGSDKEAFLATVESYDELNRILNHCVGEQKTSVDYLNDTVTTTLPNQRKEIEIVNALGLVKECSEVVKDVSRTVTREIDAKLRKETTTHLNGGQSDRYFDHKDRVIKTVSACQHMVTFEYNDACRYRKKVEHAVSDTVASLEDRCTYEFYGLNDKVRYAVDAEGYLIEYQYNAYDKQTHEIRYNECVTEQELALLKAGKELVRVPNRKQDRVHSQFYDVDGHLIAEQDGAGYVTQLIYDGMHRVDSKISYFNPSLMISDDFEMIKPTANKQRDSEIKYFYNGLKQCVKEIDACGRVTTHHFDHDGLIKEDRQYAKDGTYLVTSYTYDALRRKETVTHPNGKVTKYVYNEMNEPVEIHEFDKRFADSNKGDHCRKEKTVIDAYGQQIAHLTPLVMQAGGDGKRNVHNDQGMHVKTIDELNNVSLHYYDLDGQLVLNIDATGAVIQTTYNAFGEIIREDHYITRLTAAQLEALEGGLISETVLALIVKNSEKDTYIENTYNRRGKVETTATAKDRKSSLTYNAFREVEKEVLPDVDGKSVSINHEYEGRGKETSVTKRADGLPDISTKNEFKHQSGNVTASVNELGGRTQFELNQDGVAHETSVINEEGVKVVIANVEFDDYGRPHKVTNADGGVTTFLYSQDQLTVTIIAPNNARTVTVQNVFGEPIKISKLSAENQLLEVDEYEHAANGELEKHIDGVGNVHQTEFNLAGLKKAETLANGCKLKYGYNAALVLNRVITNADKDNSVEMNHEIDALKRIAVTRDGLGNATRNIWNAAGDLEQVIKEMKSKLNRVEERAHNSHGVITDQYRGDTENSKRYHEKNELDAYGRETAHIIDPTGLKLTSRTSHNNANKVTKKTDRNGNVTRYFYNSQGQLRFEVKQINKDKAVITERSYTASGKLSEVREYCQLVAVKTVDDEHTFQDLKLRVKPSANDVITRSYYDENNRNNLTVRWMYDAEHAVYRGAVHEVVFDGADRPVQETQYAKFVEVKDLQEWSSKLISKSNKRDQSVYKHYDKAGRLQFIVDQDGKVAESVRDSLGRLISHKDYITAVDDPASFKPSNLPKDAKFKVGHDVYDEFGNLKFKVGVNGLVVRHYYDKNNNNVRTVVFKDPIKPAHSYFEMVMQLEALTVDRNKDSVVDSIYNDANELVKQTDELGFEEIIRRDTLGCERFFIDKNKQTHEKQFDKALRQVAEFSPYFTAATVTKRENGLSYQTKKVRMETRFEVDGENNHTAVIKVGDNTTRRVELGYDYDHVLTSTAVPNAVCDAGLLGAEANVTQTRTIKTAVIRNAQGKVIAKCDENGVWDYYIYNSLGHCVYEIQKGKAVVKHEYNALGLQVKTRRYATPFDMGTRLFDDPDCCVEALLAMAHYPETPEDRITIKDYFANGKIKSETTDKVMFIHDSKLGEDSCRTVYGYDDFDEVNYIARMMAPGKWIEKAYWRDEVGNVVLEIDERHHVTYHQHDAHGNIVREIEYSEAIEKDVLFDLLNKPVEEVLRLVKKSAKLDSVKKNDYNRRGDKVREEQLDVTVQNVEFKDGLPNIYDENPIVVFKDMAISPTGKIVSVSDNQGELLHNYHNEADILVAMTEAPRATAKEELGKSKVTPLNEYIPNGFGEIVVERKSPLGCVMSKDKKPVFADLSKVINNISLRDNRGLPAFVQDGEGNLTEQTFTPSKKTASKTNMVLLTVKEAGELVKKLAIDIYKYLYNENDSQKAEYHIRDGVVLEKRFTTHNIFGDMLGQSSKENDIENYSKLDVAGNVWFHRGDKGEGIITICNLLGYPLWIIRSADIDLSKIIYEDIPNLIATQRDKLDIQQYQKHELGGIIKYFSAADVAKGAGPTMEFVFNRHEAMAQETDIEKNVTDYIFDNRKLMTAIIAPLADVVAENGAKERLRVRKEIGHNLRQGLIGTKEADCSEVHILNEVNQQLSHILADGVVEESCEVDALGRPCVIINSKNGRYEYLYDNNSNVMILKLPCGGEYRFGYDYKNNRCYMMTPGLSVYLFNFSMMGDVIARFMPNADMSKFAYNWHHDLIKVTNPDDTYQSWVRDEYSNSMFHVNLSGKMTTFVRNFLNNIKREYSGSAGKRPHLQLTRGTTSIKNTYQLKYEEGDADSNIERKYKDGLEVEVIDYALNRLTKKGYNSRGLLSELEVTELDTGNLIYKINQEYDERRRIKCIKGVINTLNNVLTDYEMNFSYDDRNNIRNVWMTCLMPRYWPECPKTFSVIDLWNKFDKANRATVLGGQLKDGRIDIANGQGVFFTYLANLCNTEQFLDPNGKLYKSSIDYDLQMRIFNLSSSFGFEENRRYVKGGWIEELKMTATDGHFSDTCSTMNDNEMLKSQVIRDNVLAKTSSGHLWDQINYLYKNGLLDQVKSTLHIKDLPTDEVETLIYNFFSRPELAWSMGMIHNKYGTLRGHAQYMHDANEVLNVKINSDDEPHLHLAKDDKHQGIVVLETTTDGKLLGKLIVKAEDPLPANTTVGIVSGTQLLLDIDLQPYFAFDFFPNPRHSYTDWLAHYGRHTGTHENLFYSPIIPFFKKLLLAKHSFPTGQASVTNLEAVTAPAPVTLQYYDVKNGDTFESIAKDVYGDPSGARLLQMHNGLFGNQRLGVNTMLVIPEYHPPFCKADTPQPLQQLLQTIHGHLKPHLQIPKQHVSHPSVIGQIIKIIAVAILVACAPHLAGMFVTSGGISLFLASAAIGAIGDASIQGLAIGLGIQQSFSPVEVISTAVTAGMASTIEGANEASKIALYAKNALKVATANVGVQLTAMALREQSKFDVALVAKQVVTSSIGIKFGETLSNAGLTASTLPGELAHNSITGTASTLMNNVGTHAPFSVKQVAVNTIAGMIANHTSASVKSYANANNFVTSKVDFQPMDVPKPGIKVPTVKRYGDVSYGLSEMNRARAGNVSSRQTSTAVASNSGLFSRKQPTPTAPTHQSVGTVDKVINGMLPFLNQVLPKHSIGLSNINAFAKDHELINKVVHGNGVERREAATELAVEGAISATVGKVMGATGKLAFFGMTRLGVVAEGASAINVSTGFKGGELYPKEKLMRLVGYLNRRGVLVTKAIRNPGFKAVSDGSMQMYLNENPTVMEVKHELSHYLDVKKLGFNEFNGLDRAEKEALVLQRLMNNRSWKTYTEAEKTFAIDYVNRLINEQRGELRYA